MVNDADIPLAVPNILQVIPHTTLWRRLKDEGRLKHAASGEYTANIPNYMPSRPEREILEDALFAWDAFYEPTNFLYRAYRSHLTMVPGQQDRPEQLQIIRRIGLSVLTYGGPFFRILWAYGVRAPFRTVFWKLLLDLLRKNPRRIFRYLESVALLNDQIEARDRVKSALSARLRELKNYDANPGL